jgi:hypothetical protein
VVSVNTNFGFGNHYVTIGVVTGVTGEPAVTRPDDWVQWKWFPKELLPGAYFPAAERTLLAYLQGVVSLDLLST